MKSIAVVVEEGHNPDWSLGHVVTLYRQSPMRIHLVNVRQPLPSYVTRFIPRQEVRAYHQENGLKAMQAIMKRLDDLGIAHRDHVLVGNKAETILEFAREYACSEIIVAKRSEGLLAELGLGSVASQLRHLLGADASCKVAEVG
ncbi:MAG TPA: universal stress protein [Burkholderiales bacterium]|nr:universal stress protein [Burkholderiales bacterium]